MTSGLVVRLLFGCGWLLVQGNLMPWLMPWFFVHYKVATKFLNTGAGATALGAQQGLFKTYAIAWAHTSASCIWEEAWTLLPGPERGKLYKSVSEPFLEIVEDILNAVYAISCRGPLDSMN